MAEPTVWAVAERDGYNPDAIGSIHATRESAEERIKWHHTQRERDGFAPLWLVVVPFVLEL